MSTPTTATDPVDGARRLTPRGEERRRQIMAFAATRFAQNGYHPTSVAELVEGVGVGKGVFYWYFDTKEQLFIELLLDAQRDLRRAQESAADDAREPLDFIEAGLRGSMRWWAAHPDLVNLFRFAATDERFAPSLRHGHERAIQHTVHSLVEGQRTGTVRPGDPEVMARAILGASVTLATELVHAAGQDPEVVADAAVAFCIGGVRAS